ncbi:hypothetical protein RB595_010242 [Gaeumannomyces hyphopodioides]
MSPSGSAFLYEPMLTPPEEPLPKRHKTLACLRCRRRKQKCDEQRPCTNCARSQETCREVIPRLAVVNSVLPTSQMQPLASPVDLCALEERVARLEKSQLHSRRHWHRRSGSSSTSSSTSTSHGEGDISGRRTGPHYGHLFSPDAAVSFHGTPTAATGLSFHHWTESPEANGRTYQQQPQQQPQQQQRQMEPYSSPPPSGNSSSLAANSAPAIGLLATFARSDNSTQGPAPGIAPTPVDRATGRALFDAYRTRVHSRFAFLRLDTLQDLALSSHSSSSSSQQQQPWVGFFTHMIYSIGLLLLLDGSSSSHSQHQHHYRLAVTRHLSAVFAHPDRVLHAQAHLLLAMHALHSPSTERLASVAGAAARYCVTAGLHLEPEPGDEAHEEEDPARTQVRRRVFWSAYALDRAVGAALDLPPAVPDAHVTTELYAAVEDAELEGWGAGGKAAGGGGGEGGPVSTALRLVRCLRVADEVLDARLRRRGNAEPAQAVVDRLDACVGGGGTAPPWLLSARDATLAMLLGLAPPPTTSTTTTTKADDGEAPAAVDSSADAATNDPASPTGSRTSPPPPPAPTTTTTTTTPPDRVALEACARFCTDHRRRTRAGGSDDWLALIAQFKCGVALLHAATTTATSPPLPAPAVRACDAALASHAERWPQARCLRDVFAALAAGAGVPLSGGCGPTARKRKRVKLESPLVGAEVAEGEGRNSSMGGPKTREAVLAQLPAVAAIVVHRPTLRMVRDLAASEQVPGRKVRVSEEEEEEEEEEEDAAEIYNALTPAFFLPEPAPVRRDTRYDYLDFGEPDDARPWFDDSAPFRVPA